MMITSQCRISPLLTINNILECAMAGTTICCDNRLQQTVSHDMLQSFVSSVAKIKFRVIVDRLNGIFTLYSYALPYKVLLLRQCSKVFKPKP
jgi:hypothetical protein